MSSGFKGIPPRVLLRDRDNRGGAQPTIVRTVSTSDRDGGHTLEPFDDRRTIVFNSGSEEYILFPILIRQSAVDNGIYDDTSFIDLTKITTGVVGHSLRAGISDAYFGSVLSEQPFAPYIEHKQFEQSNTSSFFVSGTESSIGEGFSTQLRDKTHLRLTLANTQKYEMPATTASIAYYSIASGGFGAVGIPTNPQDAFCARSSVDEAETGFPDPFDTSGMNYAYDARLFSPLGNAVITGTLGFGAAAYNCPTDNIGQLVSEKLAESLSETNASSFTQNTSYTALPDEVLPLSGVHHPFLLEKIVLELPFSASSTWLDDTTTINYNSQGQDVGGPCVTVALINETDASHREIIASGTIIPIDDDLSEVYTPVAPGTAFAAPHGFSAFSKPTVIVSGTDGHFQGRIRMELTPTVSNGVFTALLRGVNDPQPFDETRIRMINAFGRSMKRTPSGRSLFGKEFTIPAPPDGAPAINLDSNNRVDFYFFDESSPSPYVIMPDDKLLLAVAKHRSVITNPLPRDAGGDRTVMSASHEVAIDSGSIEMTLYGSLIREGKEFHFVRNEPLVTAAASEALTYENVVLDQFDVAHRSLFSGSYVDVYISGSMLPLTASTDGSGPDDASDQLHDVNFRRVKGSAIGNTTSLAFNRFVKLKATTETYYDSYMPPAEEIQATDGADLVMFNFFLSDTDAVVTLPLRSDPGVSRMDRGLGGNPLVENSKWPLGFPFEARYGNLPRQITPAIKSPITTAQYVYGEGITTDVVNPDISGTSRPMQGLMRVNRNHYPNDLPTSSIDHLQYSDPGAGTPLGAQLEPGVFNKGFYGIGDALFGQPRYVEPQVTDNYTVSSPEYHASFSRTVAIRGWKYGIIDGNQRSTNMAVSRTHFGYLRDTFEQRPYTRFVDDTGVTSSPVRVRFTSVDPADTFSSNLSAEATSSVPYFDGEVRNRGDLPSTEAVVVDP